MNQMEQAGTESATAEDAFGSSTASAYRDWSGELAPRFRNIDQRARAFASEHPFAAILAAAGIGYLVGRASGR